MPRLPPLVLLLCMISCAQVENAPPRCENDDVEVQGSVLRCSGAIFAGGPAVPRDDAVLLSQAGRALLIGGIERRGEEFLASPNVDRFNTASRTWEALEPMLSPRQAHLGLVDDRGDVVIISGLIPAAPALQLRSAEVFSATSEGWRTIAEPFAPHALGAICVLEDGRILVTGGYDASADRGGDASSTVELFDPEDGQWSLRASLPEPRMGHSSARLADGRVLVVGGNLRGFVVAEELRRETYIYDPATDAWSPGASLAFGRWRPALRTLVDGRVLVVGGEHAAGETAAEVLDATASSVRRLEAQPPPTERQALVGLGSLTLLFGNASSDRLLVAASLEPGSRVWRNLAPLPVERDEFQTVDAVVVGEDVIVSGVNSVTNGRGDLPTTAVYEITEGATD